MAKSLLYLTAHPQVYRMRRPHSSMYPTVYPPPAAALDRRASHAAGAVSTVVALEDFIDLGARVRRRRQIRARGAGEIAVRTGLQPAGTRESTACSGSFSARVTSMTTTAPSGFRSSVTSGRPSGLQAAGQGRKPADPDAMAFQNCAGCRGVQPCAQGGKVRPATRLVIGGKMHADHPGQWQRRRLGAGAEPAPATAARIGQDQPGRGVA